ncbi:MAG: UDP-3-O-acyl-N-acetylglucosamine deacetylase [Armatimonadota bacterium]
MLSSNQFTVKNRATLCGRGLHTGEECRITICPADPDTGIVFAAPNGVEIRAHAENVYDTRRGTNLRFDGVEIHTVEHLLSALAGMWIDNARIEIDGLELPACDGSALTFVELIESAGIEAQPSPAHVIELESPVWVIHNDKSLFAAPGDYFTANILISFAHPMIGEQGISLVIDPETYKKEIAPARTFCTSNEIEMILSQGLGKGGTEDNVIVIHDDRYSVPLRYDNELVRHKVLDLIGDLALIGGRLHADVMGVRTSHALNTVLADKILRV